MKLIKFNLLLLFAASTLHSQYNCFRIFPSSVNQIEPSIVKHPSNSLIMMAGSYTINGSTTSEGVYITTNGGITWTGRDIFDPSEAGKHSGDPGPIIDKNDVFIFTHLGSFPAGMYWNYSTDQGATWSTAQQITPFNQYKGSPNTDNVSSSPFYGRTYLAWTLINSPYPITLSYTSNSGISWTANVNVDSPPSGNQALGARIAIGPSGQVYVCWSLCSTTTPFAENAVGFSVSTNGGINWNATEQAYSCGGVRTTSQAPWSIRLNGFPSIDVDKTGGTRNGWIYIVTGEKNLSPAGNDPDIIFHRSTNGGSTWSQGIRVNQDALNNGKTQYFPVVVVDPTGAINVVYNDNRNSSSLDSTVEVYLSRSTNGGDNWTDYKISDHTFVPHSISGSGQGNQGDNIGMTYANGKLWPVWMDNSTGNYQIWTAGIDINTIGIKTISTKVPSSFKLSQNYPNPFNPTTNIRFEVPSSGKGLQPIVQIRVFDILGKEITTLVNQNLQPGSYEVSWDASGFPSGVYFYKLVVGDNTNNGGFSLTKKMVLTK